MKTKIALLLVLIFAILQLFNPERVELSGDVQDDFFTEVQASDELKLMIQSTCYDCHSNKSEYPWYAEIAPVSWWIDEHIEDARKHLNFSAWASYDKEKKAHKMEECWEEIEEGEMPLYSYTIMHGDARFSAEQKAQLIAFFKKQEQAFRN